MDANLDTGGLLPLNEAAQQLGIEPKRLLGFCMSPKPWMPVAGETPDGVMVYGWSLDGLRKKLAASTSCPEPASQGRPTVEAAAVE